MKNIQKIFMFLLSLSILFFTSNVYASSNSGEIILNKTAEKYDVTYGRDAKVTLSVKANPFVVVEKTDVVLVLDRSTSMNGTKMDDTKKAAIDLINLLLTEETKSNVRVGVVTYGVDVFSEWSSNKLTNDGEYLKKIIENIPSETDIGGTNIHAGLLEASNLLQNSNKERDKIVILLSDGIPNRYLGTDGETLCKNSTDSNVCKSNSSDASENIAKSMKAKSNKNGAITIYTIGFNVEESSDAYTLLGSIASTLDNRFSATDYSNLKTTFEKIVNAINIVATKGAVTDIIPVGFRLVEGSLSEGATALENQDGTTTITWIIGNIDSNTNPLLSYEVEAVTGHYGSMYTNKSAILEATKVELNPAYEETELNLNFPMPVVPIPSITHDDDYGNVGEGDTLIVGFDNNILTNDELITKHLDKEAEVINRIVLATDEDINGDIERISLNEKDGTFIYSTKKGELGKITYKYFVESEVTIDNVTTIVKSNTSYITFNIIKNATSYTVNYLEKDTNEILHDSKKVIGNAYEEILEQAIEINGYALVSDKEQKIILEVDSSKNVINFYYEKLYGKVITNYVDINGNPLAESIETIGMINTEYKTSALEIAGYELTQIDGSETGVYVKEDTIVTYIYDLIKDEEVIKIEIPQTGVGFDFTKYISLFSLTLIMFIFLIIRKRHTN